MYPTTLAVIALTFSNYVLQPAFLDCLPPYIATRLLATICIRESQTARKTLWFFFLIYSQVVFCCFLSIKYKWWENQYITGLSLLIYYTSTTVQQRIFPGQRWEHTGCFFSLNLKCHRCHRVTTHVFPNYFSWENVICILPFEGSEMHSVIFVPYQHRNTYCDAWKLWDEKSWHSSVYSM